MRRLNSEINLLKTLPDIHCTIRIRGYLNLSIIIFSRVLRIILESNVYLVEKRTINFESMSDRLINLIRVYF